MVVAVGKTDCEPDVARIPLQPLEARHVSALLELQLSVLLDPLITDVGDALSVTLGTTTGVVVDVAVTVTASVVVPSSFAQASVKVVVVATFTVLVPDVARGPLHPPDARHVSAFAPVHASVDVPDDATESGLAEISTVGSVPVAPVTVTVTFFVVVPLSLAQPSM